MSHSAPPRAPRTGAPLGCPYCPGDICRRRADYPGPMPRLRTCSTPTLLLEKPPCTSKPYEGPFSRSIRCPQDLDFWNVLIRVEPQRSQMTSPRRKTMPTVAIAQGRRAPPWLFHPEQPLPRSRPSPASTSTRPHTPNGASTPAPMMAVFLEVLGFFGYWMWLRRRRGWRFTWS